MCLLVLLLGSVAVFWGWFGMQVPTAQSPTLPHQFLSSANAAAGRGEDTTGFHVP